MIIYQPRSRVFIYIIAVISAIFFLRLFQLQVLSKKYEQFAKDNVLQRKIIYPPRGLIYDRNGTVIVSNMAVYDLMVIPGKVESIDTAELCKILDISRDDFKKNIQSAAKYSRHKASVFLKNLSPETYGILQERFYEFKGFFVQPRTIRKFPFITSAHVIGYIAEVDKNDISESDNYYHMGDYIGKSGLEKQYENELRGEYGVHYVMVDVFNIEKGRYEDGRLDKQAVAGYDLHSTIDLDVQQYAEKLMEGKRGSIVAIEPATGEVLVMVSSPSYNPNLLSTRNRAKNYAVLFRDPAKPLLNRAISGIYPPGSTFKVVMCLIGQQEGVLRPETRYSCNMGYSLPGLKIGCHSHPSPLDMHGSLVNSCNAYYVHVFRSVIDQKRFSNITEGFINWYNDVSQFGVGHRIGIDLPGEKAGILPLPERYDKIYGKGRWKSSNILSLSIGQAEISLTPLQMANIAAIVANRGYYIVPHLVSSMTRAGAKQTLSFSRHNINIEKSYFELVVDALADVPKVGTARLANIPNIEVCGKTGTAQNPHGKDHSIFIAFAPKYNPKIAIACVVENSGFGGTWAAPISGLIIEKYLNDSIPQSRKWMEERMINFDQNLPKRKPENLNNVTLPSDDRELNHIDND